MHFSYQCWFYCKTLMANHYTVNLHCHHSGISIQEVKFWIISISRFSEIPQVKSNSWVRAILNFDHTNALRKYMVQMVVVFNRIEWHTPKLISLYVSLVFLYISRNSNAFYIHSSLKMSWMLSVSRSFISAIWLTNF